MRMQEEGTVRWVYGEELRVRGGGGGTMDEGRQVRRDKALKPLHSLYTGSERKLEQHSCMSTLSSVLFQNTPSMSSMAQLLSGVAEKCMIIT